MASTTSCPFCGRELHKRTVDLGGRQVFCGWEPCDCPGAVAEREAQERAEAEEQEREERQRRLDAYRRAGIPARFLAAEHPMADELADAALSGHNAYVFGPVGTLKTTLVSAATKAIIDRGRAVKFSAMWKILDAIKDGFNTGYDPLPAYQSAPVLVLDDLGKEAPTDYALERMFALVDERSARMLPTIVTTQYRPGKLIERLAERGNHDTAIAIVSRLRQDCRTVETEGRDRRLG